MASDKDSEQDEMIRRNAENIRRNEEALRRQTEYLQQIRDHYFPRKTAWKRLCGLFLKCVGAVTVAAGILESAEWYWNERQTESMAEQSAAVAQRLFFQENDVAGARRFFEKAVELEGDKFKYRIALAYVNGISAMVDFFDLGRPLTVEERVRVDDILSEAAFLRMVEPKDPMPYVLEAQAHLLRGEMDAAGKSIDRALALAPNLALVRANACAVRFALGDFASAKAELAEAERIKGDFPAIPYWRAMLADAADHDLETARKHVVELTNRMPGNAVGHALLGRLLMSGSAPDYAAARAELGRALTILPTLRKAMQLMAESYEREGNLVLARLWCDRALEQDGTSMGGLTTRARVCGKTGDWQAAVDDLTKAIALAPFRGDLYRERSKARTALGEKAAAADDLKKAEALDRAATVDGRTQSVL